MDNNLKRLGDAEIEIMQAIWDASQPVTANYILEQIQGRRKWPLSTLMTSLARLADKGYVSCDRTYRNNLYTPLVSEEDYKAREGKNFLQKLYGNSIKGMVTSLYDGKVIGEEDLNELRCYLDSYKKEEK